MVGVASTQGLWGADEMDIPYWIENSSSSPFPFKTQKVCKQQQF